MCVNVCVYTGNLLVKDVKLSEVDEQEAEHWLGNRDLCSYITASLKKEKRRF